VLLNQFADRADCMAEFVSITANGCRHGGLP
jgi:hypothetical protein